MKKLHCVLAVLLAALVLLAIFTSLFFLLHESEHDCAGEDCPICAAIAVCRQILKQLTKLFVAVAVCSVFIKGVLFVLSGFCRFFGKITPISLNVKLLN